MHDEKGIGKRIREVESSSPCAESSPFCLTYGNALTHAPSVKKRTLRSIHNRGY